MLHESVYATRLALRGMLVQGHLYAQALSMPLRGMLPQDKKSAIGATNVRPFGLVQRLQPPASEIDWPVQRYTVGSYGKLPRAVHTFSLIHPTAKTVGRRNRTLKNDHETERLGNSLDIMERALAHSAVSHARLKSTQSTRLILTQSSLNLLDNAQCTPLASKTTLTREIRRHSDRFWNVRKGQQSVVELPGAQRAPAKRTLVSLDQARRTLAHDSFLALFFLI